MYGDVHDNDVPAQGFWIKSGQVYEEPTVLKRA
jgi:hypothetical protein